MADNLGSELDDDGVDREVIRVLEQGFGPDKTVDLSGRQLRFLPEALGKLHGLFLLNLSHNQLEMRIRMRKLALKTREKIMTTPRKEKKREARREEKAEKAAVLEKSIETELLERLKKGVYGDIYNYPVDKYNEILDKEAIKDAVSEDEEEPEIEYVEGYEELEEEDMEDFGGLATVGMDDVDDEETVAVERKRGRKDSARKLEKDEPGAKSKNKAKVLVEVEHEDANERQTAVL